MSYTYNMKESHRKAISKANRKAWALKRAKGLGKFDHLKDFTKVPDLRYILKHIDDSLEVIKSQLDVIDDQTYSIMIGSNKTNKIVKTPWYRKIIK